MRRIPKKPGVKMFPFMRYAEGLFLAHAWLAVFFLIGTVTLPWLRQTSASDAGALMARVVCSCALGLAVITLSSFLLAEVGALTPLYITADCVALLLAGAVVWRDYPWKRAFWIARLDALRNCWNAPLLIVYYVMLAIALPAVLPNVGGDPVHFYLPYAQDWAASGSLLVDPYLRFPFWPSNCALLYAVLLTFHGAPFINFLPWSVGMLSGLGICAIACDSLTGEKKKYASTGIPVFLTLALVLQPTFLRWIDTAYTDVISGAFAQFSGMCLYIACTSRRAEWLFGSAVTSAFLIGIKPSYVLLVPVFIIAIAAAARFLRVERSKTLFSLAVLLLLASPWYIRNLAVTGDPIAPVLNIALHGHDALITKQEFRLIQEDIYTEKSPRALATLPLRAFLEPRSWNLREYGVSALIVFLYVPGIFMLVAFAFNKRLGFQVHLLIFLLLCLTGYWIATSALLRYSLLLYPTLAMCVALCIACVVVRYPRAIFAMTILSAIMVLPSPGTRSWYIERAQVDYRYISHFYTSDDSYLLLNNRGYAEERATARILSRTRIHGIVYALGGDVDYFFRTDGFISTGDWVGPAGFFRLYDAIDAGQAAQFIRGLGAKAVLIDPQFALGGLDRSLEYQLLHNAFCNVPLPSSKYRLLIASPTTRCPFDYSASRTKFRLDSASRTLSS